MVVSALSVPFPSCRCFCMFQCKPCLRLIKCFRHDTQYILNRNILLSYFVWLSATRTLKLLPHLWYQPEHVIYVPAFIAFGYYFAIMKIYALCTLHEVRFISYAFVLHILLFPPSASVSLFVLGIALLFAPFAINQNGKLGIVLLC